MSGIQGFNLQGKGLIKYVIIIIIIIISRLPSHIGASLFMFDCFLCWFSFPVWPVRLSSIVLPIIPS
jgi:hypothetical protein